jgi:hypothetical protein
MAIKQVIQCENCKYEQKIETPGPPEDWITQVYCGQIYHYCGWFCVRNDAAGMVEIEEKQKDTLAGKMKELNKTMGDSLQAIADALKGKGNG